ncbi:MAG: hypothetical protein NVS9B12_11690 [Vulcanimicrobiaceae bacterium]
MQLTISGERRRCVAETLGSGVRLFAVSDGFGTLDGVRIEEAALMHLHSVLAAKSRSPRFARQLDRPKIITQMLVSVFSRLNSQLYSRSASNDDYVTCGASVTLVLLAGQRAYLAHLGNTAAYLSRGGYVIALTKDDSCTFDIPVGRAVAVSAHPPVLTRALGAAPHLELSVCSFRVCENDALVLSSKRLAGFDDRKTLSGWLLRGHAPGELGDRTIAVVPVSVPPVRQVLLERDLRASIPKVLAGVLFALGLLLIS